MKKFVLNRFLQMFLVWILVSIFSFSIIYFAPGDPLYIYMTPGATGHKMTDEEMDRMRESLGLNGNVVEQYVSWAEKLVHGNLGISINNKQPVLDQILEKLPCTVGLMGSSLVLSLLIAIPLGLIAGTHKNKLVDNIISGLTYLGISVPAFWLGIVLIILFSMKLGLLPSSGMRTIGVNSAWDVIKHGILPAVVLGLNNMAVFVRYIRSNTITQMEEEYVQTVEGLHQKASPGSYYCYTFVKASVQEAQEMTQTMRERGEIGENTYCFVMTTVFVPENENALAQSLAGNTVEYMGHDPDVPAGAWEYGRCGYATLEADGWHCELAGTGW